jgi:hypothetical protein
MQKTLSLLIHFFFFFLLKKTGGRRSIVATLLGRYNRNTYPLRIAQEGTGQQRTGAPSRPIES